MFFKSEDLKTTVIDSNSSRKVLAYGEGLMMVLVLFNEGMSPDTEIPYHSHTHVQSTFVKKGSFKFSIKGDKEVTTQIVKEGDSIYFPADSEHGCIPLEDDSQLVDAFTPIREDFL